MDRYQVEKCITIDFAEALIQRATEKAKELGVVVNIAITDEAGHLKAFRRMDKAPLLSIGIAQRKAYSAAAFRMPTNRWYNMLKENPRLLLGIPHTPDLVIFGGGAPIEVDGEMIGAIGVSGGSEAEDEAVCEAALAIIQQEYL
ncbi:GlcG/HbpS family heme-binding protein [Alicyclobacillus shizuokensis]|uniref:GlcG/HbpS family heme-binding protein n=1 Tax=Alicyclobacillus shizuokensis TaxID=392014 RepID=UPI00082FDCB9|nr:heme-binding protein [Alicyclobacillus shizuokensis]MCL6625356.1 heme-binding protein [Alicyclobacillus shizuokensis]